MNKKKVKLKMLTIFSMVLLLTSLAVAGITNLVIAQTVIAQNYENMQEGGSIPLPSGVTPDHTIDTAAYLSFRPNPVGLGQIFLVNMWITPSTHVSRYFTDYKITIQKPSGEENVVTMDSYRADTTAWFEWIADEVGEWKLKFEMPGGYFPAGNYTTHEGAVFSQSADQITSFPESVYYEPCSTDWQTLTVQEDIVYSYPASELPEDYWTRPISPEHREWAKISGWYPYNGKGGGANWPAETNVYNTAVYHFTPYVQAPNTSHVLWKRLIGLNGLIGGDLGQISFASGGGPGGGGTPSIIYAGRCYDTITKVVNATAKQFWRCYDLRTGDIYWETEAQSYTYLFFGIFEMTTTIVPTNVHFEEGHGEVPGAQESFGLNDYLVGISSGVLRKWDPYDGSLDLEVDAMDGTIYSDPYVLSVQNVGDFSNPDYRLINWTINGSTDNFAERVVSNITWPWSNLGTVQDFETGVAVQQNMINYGEAGADWIGVELRAASLKTGQELWDKTIMERSYSTACTVADHGKVAVLMKDGDFLGFNLLTGTQAWRSEQMDYPWDAPSFGAYSIHSAYGMFYRTAYSGVYAFDWDDGSIVWKYEAPADSPYETPYVTPEGETVYSFNAGGQIADGKIFAFNTEHTTTQPVTRGWGLHCIDAYTGQGIWNITGFMTPGGMADGYLTAAGGYDGYMYVFGKGESKTNVMAPLSAVIKGSPITISGSVLDMSPGQAETPCVSENSMTLQMEYLHLQRPIDGIWHNETISGVPVSITAIAEDGTYIDIGTAITDGYSGTFGKAWTPTDEGTYKIVAAFAGDDSYGSSSATAWLTVGPSTTASIPIQPEEPTKQEPTQPTPEEPTPEEPVTDEPTPEEPTPEEPEPSVEELPLISSELAIIIAVVAACIIGTLAYVALRRRK